MQVSKVSLDPGSVIVESIKESDSGQSEHSKHDAQIVRGKNFNEVIQQKKLIKKQEKIMEHNQRKIQINNSGLLVRKPWIIYPEDKFKTVWDIFQSFVLLLSCILTPFNLAFADEVEEYLWYTYFNYSIDVTFLLDIIVIFNCAVEVELNIEDKRFEIALIYLKGWFLIDLLSILPFELMIPNAIVDGQEVVSSAENANSFVRITRISKLYKLVKITKLIRMFKILKNKKKITKNALSVVKNGYAFDRLFYFILILFLVSHFFGCMWIFVGNTLDDDDGVNWIYLNNFEKQNVPALYSTSAYFTMQTLATVGYGDIQIGTSNERILCILLQFIGVIFFSFAAGSLTTIIANSDESNSQNQERT